MQRQRRYENAGYLDITPARLSIVGLHDDYIPEQMPSAIATDAARRAAPTLPGGV